MSKGRSTGVALGLLGLVVWAVPMIYYAPPFFNKFKFFMNTVTNLSPADYIMPLAFALFAVFSYMRLRTASLAASVIALIMCGIGIFKTSGSVSGPAAAVTAVAVLCVLAAVFRKN